ncbi:MAG: DUF3301 domain-containing protein [Gammaproteobacteria bacterium]|nr:DUF3301 domain-containing protein [Gammaproteobacteria bacterium]
MSATDFTIFIILVSGFVYWLDSIRAKEVATTKSREACNKVSLEFLDETVAIKKLRLRRNNSGRLVFYREYQFEFTSTGEYRYKGIIILLGKSLLGVEMEPYQFNED